MLTYEQGKDGVPHMAYRDVKEGQAYINRYKREHYDRITIMRTKGDKDKLDEIASDRGVSRNELLNWCIDQQLRTLGIKL